MKFSTLQSIADVHTIIYPWNTLLQKSAICVPFLQYEYVNSWWQSLGGGEWKQGELFVVTAHEEDTLIGIAPMFRTLNQAGEPVLMLLGSIEISDYLDIIVEPAHLSDFLSELLEYLNTFPISEWVRLDWYNLLDNTPTLPALKLATERMGWEYNQEPCSPAPFISLPADWDSYLAILDKKQRHEIRRKIRRTEENIPAGHWYIVEDEENLKNEMDDFLNLMAQDANKAIFLTETMRAQMHDIAHIAFLGGWLQLAFLEFGGIKAAGYLSFDYANHIWVYNSGLNADFSQLSPGWVLLGYLIQWAIEHKRNCFDFMRGDEIYKYRFGAVDRFVVCASIRR